MIGKLLVHQLLAHAYILIIFLPTETVNDETTTRNNCANKTKQTTTFNSLVNQRWCIIFWRMHTDYIPVLNQAICNNNNKQELWLMYCVRMCCCTTAW
jgi:hypothetical protein